MKKIILTLLALLPLSIAMAEPIELSIKVSGLAVDKPHFLCLYGAGCYNMRSAEKGKVFPLHPHVLPNLKKVFIADIRTHQLYGQSMSDSCRNVLTKNTQTVSRLTIAGKLVVKDSRAEIEGLRCELN